MQQQKEQEWTRQKPTTSRRRNSRRGNDVKASVEREEEDWESEWETEENTHWRKTTRTRFKLCYSFLNCDNSQILSKQADDESKLKIWQNTGNKQKKNKSESNCGAEQSQIIPKFSFFFFLFSRWNWKRKCGSKPRARKWLSVLFLMKLLHFIKYEQKVEVFFGRDKPFSLAVLACLQNIHTTSTTLNMEREANRSWVNY